MIKFISISVIFISFTFFLIFCLAAGLGGKGMAVPEMTEYTVKKTKERTAADAHDQTLKILTLNIAHGRKDGLHQIFLSREKIKSNLDDIVSLIGRESPDFIAFQEADGRSLWSGRFDHVQYIAEKSGFAHCVRGRHVDGLMMSYGTALLSGHELFSPTSVTFPPSPPAFPKGFVSADVCAKGEFNVKIISLHLDFLQEALRKKQVNTLLDIFSKNQGPFVVMGDFNCEWEEGSAIELLAAKLDLKCYNRNTGNMVTFPKLNRRLDYILVSKDFEFMSYRVLNDIVSDHYVVIAEIRKKT